MCHLIFFLPVAGIPFFWLLPLGYALLINGSLWLTSAFLYWLIKRAMDKPVNDGFQSLIGTEATVVSKQEHSAKYLIRAKSAGELWSAYSQDTLQPGELVNIV